MTITQYPNEIIAAHGSNFITVHNPDYDRETQKEYYYTCTLYDAEDNIIVTLKTSPHPSAPLYGTFDLKPIISLLFTKADFADLDKDQVIAECPNHSYLISKVVIGDHYTISDEYTENLNVLEGDAITVLNTVVRNGDVLDTDNLLLTDADFIKTSERFPYQFIYFQRGNDVKGVKVNGVIIPVDDSSGATHVQRVSVGCSEVSGATSWDVVCVNNSNVEIGKKVRVVKEHDCGLYPDSYQVYWMNRGGGFESFLFNKVNYKTDSKKVQSFEKNVGRFVGGQYVISKADHSTVNYTTDISETIELRKKFLTDNEIDLLAGLMHSPCVYVRNSKGELLAATVDTKTYKYQYVIHERGYVASFNISLNGYSVQRW